MVMTARESYTLIMAVMTGAHPMGDSKCLCTRKTPVFPSAVGVAWNAVQCCSEQTENEASKTYRGTKLRAD